MSNNEEFPCGCAICSALVRIEIISWAGYKRLVEWRGCPFQVVPPSYVNEVSAPFSYRISKQDQSQDVQKKGAGRAKDWKGRRSGRCVFFMGGRDGQRMEGQPTFVWCVWCLGVGWMLPASCWRASLIPPHTTWRAERVFFSPWFDTLDQVGVRIQEIWHRAHSPHLRLSISCDGFAPIRRADGALARGLDKDLVREHDLTGSHVQGSPAGFRSLRSPRSQPISVSQHEWSVSLSLRRPPSGFCYRATTEKRWATTSWSFLHSARPSATSGCVLCRWDERINGPRSHSRSRSPDLTFDLPSHLIKFWIQEVSQESGEKDINAQLSIPSRSLGSWELKKAERKWHGLCTPNNFRTACASLSTAFSSVPVSFCHMLETFLTFCNKKSDEPNLRCPSLGKIW